MIFSAATYGGAMRCYSRFARAMSCGWGLRAGAGWSEESPLQMKRGLGEESRFEELLAKRNHGYRCVVRGRTSSFVYRAVLAADHSGSCGHFFLTLCAAALPCVIACCCCSGLIESHFSLAFCASVCHLSSSFRCCSGVRDSHLLRGLFASLFDLGPGRLCRHRMDNTEAAAREGAVHQASKGDQRRASCHHQVALLSKVVRRRLAQSLVPPLL
jgi:hypothetical protein